MIFEQKLTVPALFGLRNCTGWFETLLLKHDRIGLTGETFGEVLTTFDQLMKSVVELTRGGVERTGAPQSFHLLHL